MNLVNKSFIPWFLNILLLDLMIQSISGSNGSSMLNPLPTKKTYVKPFFHLSEPTRMPFFYFLDFELGQICLLAPKYNALIRAYEGRVPFNFILGEKCPCGKRSIMHQKCLNKIFEYSTFFHRSLIFFIESLRATMSESDKITKYRQVRSLLF